MFETLAANTTIDTTNSARLEAAKYDAESLKPSRTKPNTNGPVATPLTLIGLDSANSCG
jgi:hypothetical protein